jgi:carbamoylphosphate synthase large subunit
VIVQFGGQTPLKLARDLERCGVPIIGTSPDMIDCAEDRERFQKLLAALDLRQPPNRTARDPQQAMRLAGGNRLPAGGAPELRARRARDGDRARAGRSRSATCGRP